MKRCLTWLDRACAIPCSALKDAARNPSSLVEIGARSDPIIEAIFAYNLKEREKYTDKFPRRYDIVRGRSAH